MKEITCIIIWTCFTIFQINATDTYLNFTTAMNLGSNVKEILSQQIGSVRYNFIIYSNTTICRYDSQFKYLSQMNSSLFGGSTLSNLKIVSGYDGDYLNGIAQGGSSSITVAIDNVDIKYSILGFNLKHVTLLYVDRSGGLILMEYLDDIARIGNRATFNVVLNFSQNMNVRNYVVKVLTVDTRDENKYDVVFTSLKQVYLFHLNCNAFGSCRILQIKKIKSLITVSNHWIKGYFIDVNFIITIQFSDGKIYSFYYNGNDIPIDLSTVQAQTGSSTLQQIVSQNAADSLQRVFVFGDKSIRALWSYFTDSNGRLINGSYTYLNNSQDSFPISNWTGLAELSLSDGNVYTKNSPIIFSYCYTKQTGIHLTGCQSTILCPIFACYICNSARTQCLTCLQGYKIFSGICSLCTVTNCQICNVNQTCTKCTQNYTLNQVSNTCQSTSVPDKNTTFDQIQNQNNSTNSTYTMNSTHDDEIGPIDPIFNQSYHFQLTPPQPEKLQNETNQMQPTDPQIFNETNNNHSESSQNDKKYLNFENQSSTAILITKTLQNFDPSVQKLSIISYFVNSFPGSRQIFGFLTPIFAFFDDYWYYIYHEDKYVQLNYTPLFLVFMYTVNQQRILPEYMNLGIPFNVSSFIRSNYTNYTHGQIVTIQNNQTYFIENIQQMIFQQYILIFFGILFVKLIIFFLQFCISKQVKPSSDDQKLKHSRSCSKFPNILKDSNHEIKNQRISKKTQQSVLSALKIWLQNFISLKSVFLMLFSSNLMFIFFTFSSQILIIFSFTSLDKGNQALNILIGFIMIAFTVLIALYQELFCRKRKKKESSNRIWSWQVNKKSKIISLNQAKRQNFFLTYFTHIKTIFYGFVHGFFIRYPNIQYTLLVLIKFYLVYMIITRKQMIRSSTLSLCMFLYFVGGIFLDVLCYLSKNEMIPNSLTQNFLSDYSLINMFEILCLMTICSSVLCQILVEIYLGIKGAFFSDDKRTKQLYKHNTGSIFKVLRRVLPQNRNQKSSNDLKIKKNSIDKSEKMVSFQNVSPKKTEIMNFPNNYGSIKDFIVQKQSKKQLRNFHNLNNIIHSKMKFQKPNISQLKESQSNLARSYKFGQIQKKKVKLTSLKQNRIKEKSLTTTVREKVKPINTIKIQFLKDQIKDINQIDEIKKISIQQSHQEPIQKLQYLNFVGRFKAIRQHKLQKEIIQKSPLRILEISK